jgi:hypothetical protein
MHAHAASVKKNRFLAAKRGTCRYIDFHGMPEHNKAAYDIKTRDSRSAAVNGQARFSSFYICRGELCSPAVPAVSM